MNAPCVRSRDPPCRWQDAERPGRVSYLPHQSMKRVYRSEQARRRLMAEDEAAWRQLRNDIDKRERSDAALELLADAFAAILVSEFCTRPNERRETQTYRLKKWKWKQTPHQHTAP